MRHELTAETLARLILWGLDQAMAGRPRPLRLRSAPAPTAPLVALIDYVSGFPCLWVTPFAFYGEKTAKLLQALDRSACKAGNWTRSSAACCTRWNRAAAWCLIGWWTWISPPATMAIG